MPYAVIDDSVSLYYEVEGEGLPIVFIHPFVMGHNVFMHQRPLATHYQTIFYDLRGHGQSSKGVLPITIDLLAHDLKKLLDRLGIEKAVLCGYSQGGLVAQEFALLFPERTHAIILSGGFSELNNFTPKFFISSIMAMARLGQVPMAAKLQAKLNKRFPQDEKRIYDYGKQADGKRAAQYCKAGLKYNSTHSLYRLKMPILLVYGSLETPMHHYRIPFERAAPQTQVVFIDKGTHQVPPQSFEKFNAAVHRFLAPIAERKAVRTV
jgi:pimeloyl-ACP methyl ester carboxylesterase